MEGFILGLAVKKEVLKVVLSFPHVDPELGY